MLESIHLSLPRFYDYDNERVFFRAGWVEKYFATSVVKSIVFIHPISRTV